MANPEAGPITRIESLEAWAKAFQLVRGFGICGLDMETTGQDPLTSRIWLVQLALPSNRVYIADIFVALWLRIVNHLPNPRAYGCHHKGTESTKDAQRTTTMLQAFWEPKPLLHPPYTRHISCGNRVSLSAPLDVVRKVSSIPTTPTPGYIILGSTAIAILGFIW